jgi:two-component system LytT family sensor kinase
MTKSLFAYRKFNALFIVLFLSWSLTHIWIVHDVFKFSWLTSIWDSIIYNSLLAASAVLISLVLLFYKPLAKSIWTSLIMILVITYIWVDKSPWLLSFVSISEKNYLDFIDQSFLLRFIFGLMINSSVLGVSWFWYGIEEQREQVKRQQKIEDLAKEAELLSLRQKLQPHFLFNSLNSISALVVAKPELARTMIHQLSDFLRSTLRQEENKKISVIEEIKQLELYLAIEKVRFGHRLNTLIEIEEDLNAHVPAMILQPVVENAIKFGLYDTVGTVDINIKVKMFNTMVNIEVSNPFDPQTRNANDKGTGFGLNSIQRRLYLLYARIDLLHTKEENGLFITTINIPQ